LRVIHNPSAFPGGSSNHGPRARSGRQRWSFFCRANCDAAPPCPRQLRRLGNPPAVRAGPSGPRRAAARPEETPLRARRIADSDFAPSPRAPPVLHEGATTRRLNTIRVRRHSWVKPSNLPASPGTTVYKRKKKGKLADPRTHVTDKDLNVRNLFLRSSI